MKLMADSCVLVWWLDDPSRLSGEARAAIGDPVNEVFFSAASVWELLLKIRKGKLAMPTDFPDRLIEDGFTPLPVTVGHATRSQCLPPIHDDPFDRLLVAQALEEGLVFLTRDALLASYPVALLRA